MNSKSEFNRCQLPRLSVMMGEREVKNDMEAEMTMKEEEEAIMKERKRKETNHETELKSPPRKKKRRWLEDVPKKRKRKKENQETTQNVKKLRPQSEKVHFLRTVAPASSPGQKYPEPTKSGGEIFKSNKTGNIIAYFNKLSESQTLSPRKPQKLKKLSNISQGGGKTPSSASSTQIEGSSKSEYKANCNLSRATTTYQSPHSHKKKRIKRLTDLPEPKFNYVKLSSIFKPTTTTKTEPNSEKETDFNP